MNAHPVASSSGLSNACVEKRPDTFSLTCSPRISEVGEKKPFFNESYRKNGDFLPDVSDESGGEGSEDEEMEDDEFEEASEPEDLSDPSSDGFSETTSETSSAVSFASTREEQDPAVYSGLKPDEYFYCDVCQDWIEDGCLDHPPNFVEDDDSSSTGIPDSLLINFNGDVAARFSIEEGSLFGPLRGPVTETFVAVSIAELPYIWEVKKYNGKSAYFLPPKQGKIEYWMQLIGFSKSESEQNLIAVQFRGDVYYKSIKPIAPNDQLKVGRAEGLPWTKEVPYDSMISRYGKKKCPSCPATSVSNYNLHVTSTRHRPLDDLICRICNHVANSRSSLRVHNYRNHQQKPFPCPVCPRRMVSQRGLQSHVAKAHMTPKSKNHRCHICSKAFRTKQKVHNHMSTHGLNTFQCPRCPAKLCQEGMLKTHMEAVHGDGHRMYACEYPGCEKSFTTKVYLNGHVKRTHVNPKPKPVRTPKPEPEKGAAELFQCRFCDKVYRHVNARCRHENKAHPEEKAVFNSEKIAKNSDRPFACHLCPSKFSQKPELKYHIARHTGLFEHFCTICAKGYPTLSEVKKHIKRSHGEKSAVVSSESGELIK